MAFFDPKWLDEMSDCLFSETEQIVNLSEKSRLFPIEFTIFTSFNVTKDPQEF